MHIKRILSLILVLIITCFFSGCDDSAEKRIYFELTEKPQTLDPQTAQSDAELLIVRNLFEGLTRVDKNGKVALGVAEKYDKNGNEYTFYLRKNAKWDSGEELTAHDFVFGFQRAVDPKTESPFAERLMCIDGVPEIRSGRADIASLGVTAVNKRTLKITLREENPEFLKILSTAPCMPCNKEFFEGCVGKYGLEQGCVLANGSYYLAKWNQNEFGIRIYKNAQYFGDFTAKNGGVFLSKNKEKSALSELVDQRVDAAFLNSADVESAKKNGYKIQSLQNICWVLTISGEYSAQMRSAFAMSIDRNALITSDMYGTAKASSVFPEILPSSSYSPFGIKEYNEAAAKTAFSAAVKGMPDKKFPKTTLYYYDDAVIKGVANDMIGHWQQVLSAFINMEASANLDALQNELSEQTLQMALFPVTAKSDSLSEYTNQFPNNASADTIIPLLFQSTSIAYGKTLSGLKLDKNNGYIDFSFVVKSE